jgi:hypothetical protein
MLPANGSPCKKNGLKTLCSNEVTIETFTNAYRPEKSVLLSIMSMTIKF